MNSRARPSSSADGSWTRPGGRCLGRPSAWGWSRAAGPPRPTSGRPAGPMAASRCSAHPRASPSDRRGGGGIDPARRRHGPGLRPGLGRLRKIEGTHRPACRGPADRGSHRRQAGPADRRGEGQGPQHLGVSGGGSRRVHRERQGPGLESLGRPPAAQAVRVRLGQDDRRRRPFPARGDRPRAGRRDRHHGADDRDGRGLAMTRMGPAVRPVGWEGLEPGGRSYRGARFEHVATPLPADQRDGPGRRDRPTDRRDEGPRRNRGHGRPRPPLGPGGPPSRRPTIRVDTS